MGYRTWHWRIYNVLRRLMGLWFILVGAIGLFSSIAQRLGWADGPPMTPGQITTSTVICSLAIAYGIFLCRRVTLRPDLGDWLLEDYFIRGRTRPSEAERRARSWWTGNPRKAVDR